MPSIVIGVFVYGIVVLPFRQFTALAGGVALGIMMIPIIARTTEELLLLVPRPCAKARWRSARRAARAMFSVILPAALPGIVTGIMLALARIAGETAPLLFTAFNNRFFSTRLDQPISTLDRAGLHLRQFALRRLAPSGLGRRARAGVDRLLLLAAGALRHAPARRTSGRTLMTMVTDTPTTDRSHPRSATPA